MDKHFESIFIINDKGLLEINKPEIRNIKEFRAILTRDKGGTKGDYDGRNKHFAFKELMFVHQFVHPASAFKDLGDEDREKVVIDHCSFDKAWKPDKVVKAACDKYKELINMSALYYSYNNASKAIYSIGKDINFFNEQKNKRRKELKELVESSLDATLDVAEIQEMELRIELLTNSLLKLGEQIISLTTKLDKAFVTLQDLKDKLLAEEQGGSNVRGGGKLGNREQM